MRCGGAGRSGAGWVGSGRVGAGLLGSGWGRVVRWGCWGGVGRAPEWESCDCSCGEAVARALSVAESGCADSFAWGGEWVGAGAGVV